MTRQIEPRLVKTSGNGSLQLATALLLLLATPPAQSATALPAPAAALYQQAQTGRWFADSAKLAPALLATSDGQSFLAVWKPAGMPGRWIVSLHGTRGYATDDLALWHRNAGTANVGIVSLQWWLGRDDNAYYTPQQVYREIDLALQAIGVRPGTAMLHGFSRGSANTYAVAAIDAGKGRRYFSLVAASSGGVAVDYPPTRAVLDGTFGERPLRNTRWVTIAGARDPNPDRDGIPGMRRTAAWLREQGAQVLEQIEDPTEGHGALQRNPANVRRLLDLFAGR